jgi:hypothetical protein
MQENQIELSELIQQLRIELAVAMAEGEGKGVRFEAEKLEIELKVEVKKSAEGKGGVRFWVVNADAGGKKERGVTQTIKLSLKPKTAADGPLNVSDTTASHPVAFKSPPTGSVTGK